METNTESTTPPNLEDSTAAGGSSSMQSNTVQENVVDDTNGQVDTEAVDGGDNKRGGRKESEAWKHFDRVTINGEKKAKCKYCKKIYVARASDGTTHLLKHNSKCHGKAQVDMRQYALKNARSLDGKVHIANYVFDQDKARSDLARMIIKHEYPLSIVDHSGFIEFCQSLQPAFTLVSRNTIKGDIMKIYDVEKASLMKLLDKNKSRIAITSDMWTASNQKKGYMVVTAHFIDDSWALQSRIMRFKVFYDVTKLFSGTQYPTANLYFPQICEIRLALSKWLVSDIPIISEMASNMVTKYEKYWHMIHGIMGVAAVFDPRYKFELLEFYYVDIFDQNAEEEINKIRTLCFKLLNEYEMKENIVSRNGKTDSSSSSHSQTQLSSIDSSFISRQRFDEYLNRKISKENTKSELDRYLEEPMLPISDSFDILAWWKNIGIRYPIMQMIAKDIYAIPISTVASESAFSTGGRLISPHRSRLHPVTLEALMCSQSWLSFGSSKGRVIPTMDTDSESDDDGQGVGSS